MIQVNRSNIYFCYPAPQCRNVNPLCKNYLHYSRPCFIVTCKSAHLNDAAKRVAPDPNLQKPYTRLHSPASRFALRASRFAQPYFTTLPTLQSWKDNVLEQLCCSTFLRSCGAAELLHSCCGAAECVIRLSP